VRYTVGMNCKCGAFIGIDGRSHRVKWRSLIHSFTELHKHCTTQSSDDVNEEPGGDVFTQASIAREHSEPELVTGFQRQLW